MVNVLGKNASTALPKMIGSETFIIVALRCTEYRTPSALARATCALRNSTSAAARITEASMISPASSLTSGLGRWSSRPPDQLDAYRAVLVHDRGLLVVAEVVGVHVRDSGLGVLGPGAHRMRVSPGVRLHRGGRAAVGVALPQHRVDRAALDLVVPAADLALFIGLGVGRVVGDGEPLALQLGDGGPQLRDRGGDVRELDDVGVGSWTM